MKTQGRSRRPSEALQNGFADRAAAFHPAYKDFIAWLSTGTQKTRAGRRLPARPACLSWREFLASLT